MLRHQMEAWRELSRVVGPKQSLMETGKLGLYLLMSIIRSMSLLQSTLVQLASVHTYLGQHILGSSAQFLDLA